MSEWEKRNEEYVGEISGDADLTDEEFIEVLEDLCDRAQSAIDAKRTELDADAEELALDDDGPDDSEGD